MLRLTEKWGTGQHLEEARRNQGRNMWDRMAILYWLQLGGGATSSCNTVQSGNPDAVFTILIRLERVPIPRDIPKERAFQHGRSVLRQGRGAGRSLAAPEKRLCLIA